MKEEQSMFTPTERDRDGLRRLLTTIDRDQRRYWAGGVVTEPHDSYKIACFSKDEAYWIREQIETARPNLRGRVGISWLTWPKGNA